MNEIKQYIGKQYNVYLDIAKNITHNKKPDYEDLLHTCIEQLLKTNPKKLKSLIKKKHLLYFMARIMLNNYHSNTSPYYYTYKRYNDKTNTLSPNYIYKSNKHIIKSKEEDEIKFKYIEEQLNGLYWYDAQVFKIYFLENHSLTSMAKATKISKYSLRKSLKKVKEHFKKTLKNDKKK